MSTCSNCLIVIPIVTDMNSLSDLIPCDFFTSAKAIGTMVGFTANTITSDFSMTGMFSNIASAPNACK